ncbi:hypothetical protein KO516_21440 [Citreicella sp. C3M06]|nr:hypothetical protein [Citreicella sp. C3M06]
MSLADRLIKNRHPSDEWAGDLAARLSMPAENHSPQWHPMVERFVFDDDGALPFVLTLSSDEHQAAMDNLRVPMNEFWLETPQSGYHCAGDDVTIYVRDRGLVLSVGGFKISDVRKRGGVGMSFYNPPNLEASLEDPERLAAMEVGISSFAIFCALINSPRSATCERIIPRADTQDQRILNRRKAQRGCPVYSFNRVRMIRPGTSRQSSTVLCGEQTSKRGHWVVGHWRLVDKNMEPYWTWVASHKRGDDAQGFIAHERHISIAPESFETRRGFVIPHIIGKPGQRVEAQRP